MRKCLRVVMCLCLRLSLSLCLFLCWNLCLSLCLCLCLCLRTRMCEMYACMEGCLYACAHAGFLVRLDSRGFARRTAAFQLCDCDHSNNLNYACPHACMQLGMYVRIEHTHICTMKAPSTCIARSTWLTALY